MVSKHRPDKALQIQEPGENTRFVAHGIEVARLPKIDYDDPVQVEKRFWEYLEICCKNDMKPNVPGFALALGTSRQVLWKWANGLSPQKNPEVVAICQRCYSFLNAYLEDAGIGGKINPAAYIFAAKNHFGYQDQTNIIVAPDNREAPPEEVLIAEAQLLDDGDED